MQGSPYDQCVCGETHACCKKEDGTLVCNGRNDPNLSWRVDEPGMDLEMDLADEQNMEFFDEMFDNENDDSVGHNEFPKHEATNILQNTLIFLSFFTLTFLAGK